MVKDLHIRNIDDKEHSKISKIAEERGVSINSIVKDAIDKWLLQKPDVPKKHFLLIYDDDKAAVELLKSVDKIAQEQGLVRAFCAPPGHPSKKALTKLGWIDGTVEPYTLEKDPVKYTERLVKELSKISKKGPLFGIDFILADMASLSFEVT
ncbi:MAG: hypothetical protein P8X83_08125 [Nitrosopumilaceae archaeon]